MAGSCDKRIVVFALLIFGMAVSLLGTADGYRPFPGAPPFQQLRNNPRNRSSFANLEGFATWAESHKQRAPGGSSAVIAMRHLLDSQTPSGPAMASAEHRRHHHMSRKRLLVIILTSTTAFMVAVGIFLVLWWVLRARKRRNNGSTLKIWTNQLSTMHQRHGDSAELSSSDSCKGSARFESATKFWPWPSYSHDKKSDGIKSSAGSSPCCLAYPMLQAATNNFNSTNLLGEGSFGLVYKARLDNDACAAVKRLTGAGQHCLKEFQSEVDLMSKIRHSNLVALLGYSSDGPEPLVVYELMQNGSLHDQLHGPSCGKALTWSLRLKIALEAARGLEHLHEDCKPAIIHRDFKASNILLDASFNAKVSDFGLAVALEESGFLKEDVLVQGTFGYIAPEYLMDGTLTEKSDVYGFGVVLLELLTGRLPIDTSLPLGSQSLVTWVKSRTKKQALLLHNPIHVNLYRLVFDAGCLDDSIPKYAILIPHLT
ncbi:hypothetical protein M758_UG136000 [Ceratodon purpureus]|nr:hypothetical protein M758_UG136000 [Ceratodon purpureus]